MLGDEALIQISKSTFAKNLKSLDLSWLRKSTMAGFCIIAEKCSKLENLSLRGNMEISDISPIISNLTKLQHLDIGDMRGSNFNVWDQIERVAPHCFNLKSINLEFSSTKGLESSLHNFKMVIILYHKN